MKDSPPTAPSLDLRPLKRGASTAGGELPFLLRITPPIRSRSGERPRLNLALVIDRSGSMSGAPLEQAKLASIQAVEMLSESDRVSVVTYDTQVDVIVPNTLATARDRITRAVRAVEARGTTALHAGWLEGATQAANHLDPEALNRVVLLTDGRANAGETRPDTICSDVAGLAGRGITTSALGLGRTFNEDLLEGIADAGGGNFYLIENPAGLRDIFAAELHGLSATFGTNARLSFRPSVPGVEVAEILNQLHQDGEALVLPDLIGGLPIEIAGVMRLPTLPLGETDLGSVILTWNDPRGQPFELTQTLQIEVLEDTAYTQLPEDSEVASVVAELRAAHLKRDATRAIDRGDRTGAAALLNRAKRGLRSAPQTARVQAELGEFDTLDAALSAGDDQLARKRMLSQAYRKRRSYYHERLGKTRAVLPSEEHHEVRRKDGTIGVLQLALGDLTDERVDAIVNPTNPGLFGSGPTVDGAVHRRGGRQLTLACREIGPVEIGQTVLTPGFRLPARYVLHSAVPKWEQPKAEALMAACYTSALRLAQRMDLHTVSVPAMGAGMNGFPTENAARIALETLLDHLRGEGTPEVIRIVLFDRETLDRYRLVLALARLGMRSRSPERRS